jgi:hypothetical protein
MVLFLKNKKKQQTRKKVNFVFRAANGCTCPVLFNTSYLLGIWSHRLHPEAVCLVPEKRAFDLDRVNSFFSSLFFSTHTQRSPQQCAVAAA